MENNCLIKLLDKKILPNGVYSAHVEIGGLRPRYKTFFPSHWSREKVVSAIFEAYDDFLRGSREIKFTKRGDYRLKGKTSEHIELELIIERYGKKIETAYPFIERKIIWKDI